MRREQADFAYLWDMLDAARAVSEFVGGRSFHDYLTNRMLRGAVERQVEIIGEAAGKVSVTFRDAHPEIPWRRIIAQRHVLAHEYGDVRHELLWRVATDRIPELIRDLSRLIPSTPETGN
ncbi:MAG: DUF86 domain-containing protein [candidate division Zixibacteria bacterium]|nr:DUF86 domain-containing protein [candidate division Zixibacteria bacterium]